VHCIRNYDYLSFKFIFYKCFSLIHPTCLIMMMIWVRGGVRALQYVLYGKGRQEGGRFSKDKGQRTLDESSVCMMLLRLEQSHMPVPLTDSDTHPQISIFDQKTFLLSLLQKRGLLRALISWKSWGIRVRPPKTLLKRLIDSFENLPKVSRFGRPWQLVGGKSLGIRVLNWSCDQRETNFVCLCR